MRITLSPQEVAALTNTLSPVRLSTYAAATGFSPQATPLDIYVWNALLSGAFFSPLHICEVAVRNGVSVALERKYGGAWPWHTGFERTLPKKMKEELQRARGKVPPGSTGKVVAELKFVFWCQMFTSRHDAHLWNAHLWEGFPFIPFVMTVESARKYLYDEMEAMRHFRNRIAHHEPIFAYPLISHKERIEKVLRLRCGHTFQWLAQWEVLSATMAAKP